MNATSEPDRERILERLVTGELDPGSEEGRRHLERDPELRAELEALGGIAEALDDAAREAEERGNPPADGADLACAEAALGEIWAREGRISAPRRRRRLVWLGVAAGVLIAAIVGRTLLREGGEPVPPEPVELGGARLKAEEPDGEVDAFVDFRWSGELPPGYTLELSIRDAVTGELLHSEPRLSGDSWRAPAALSASLPRSILWSVTARMPGGEEAFRSPEIAAWRRDT